MTRRIFASPVTCFVVTYQRALERVLSARLHESFWLTGYGGCPGAGVSRRHSRCVAEKMARFPTRLSRAAALSRPCRGPGRARPHEPEPVAMSLVAMKACRRALWRLGRQGHSCCTDSWQCLCSPPRGHRSAGLNVGPHTHPRTLRPVHHRPSPDPPATTGRCPRPAP